MWNICLSSRINLKIFFFIKGPISKVTNTFLGFSFSVFVVTASMNKPQSQSCSTVLTFFNLQTFEKWFNFWQLLHLWPFAGQFSSESCHLPPHFPQDFFCLSDFCLGFALSCCFRGLKFCCLSFFFCEWCRTSFYFVNAFLFLFSLTVAVVLPTPDFNSSSDAEFWSFVD